MGIKMMFSFLLVFLPFEAEANLQGADSTILSGESLYERKLNDFLEMVVGSNRDWKLCYRASRDGWAAETFHDKCDGKPNTVSIIKVGDSVFGGFTDTPWDTSGEYGYSSNAFIFSLHNNEGLGPFMSMIKSPRFAIFNDAFYGPTFGRGYDIQIENYANRHSYSYTEFGNAYTVPSGVKQRRTILAGTYSFSPDEVEVFYLA